MNTARHSYYNAISYSTTILYTKFSKVSILILVYPYFTLSWPAINFAGKKWWKIVYCLRTDCLRTDLLNSESISAEIRRFLNHLLQDLALNNHRPLGYGSRG